MKVVVFSGLGMKDVAGFFPMTLATKEFDDGRCPERLGYHGGPFSECEWDGYITRWKEAVILFWSRAYSFFYRCTINLLWENEDRSRVPIATIENGRGTTAISWPA